MAASRRSCFIILSALVTAASGAFLTSDAADVTAAPRLPNVTGKDLNGKPWKAPAVRSRHHAATAVLMTTSDHGG
jgi:hypothetical protein